MKLLRIEKQPRKSGGPRIVYVLQCSEDGCINETKVRKNEIERYSLKCKTHSHIKKPFESLYNRILSSSKRKNRKHAPVNLTYEEFLEFTKINRCYYCYKHIDWTPYCTVNGKFKSSAYYLDRIDNNKGYSKDNCLVCCTKCNKTRGNRYTYDEWYGMTEYFRKQIV